MTSALVGAVAGMLATPLVMLVADRLRRHREIAGVSGWWLIVVVTGLSGLAGASAAHQPGIGLVLLFAMFGALTVTAAAVDLAELRLPDLLTYPLLAGGLLLLVPAAIAGWPGSPWRALIAGAAYGGWMLLIALIVPGGYGLGDVKLAAAIGLWLGLLSLPVITAAVLFGQVLIVISLLAARLRHRRNPTGATGPDTPLGPALVAGAALALLFG